MVLINDRYRRVHATLDDVTPRRVVLGDVKTIRSKQLVPWVLPLVLPEVLL